MPRARLIRLKLRRQSSNGTAHSGLWLMRDGGGKSVTQNVRGSISIRRLNGLHHAVSAGLGIAALPGRLMQQALPSGELIEVLPNWTVAAHQPEGAMWMTYPARDLLPQKMRLATEFFRRAV